MRTVGVRIEVKKAVNVFLPDAQPVALMLDSKAETSHELERIIVACTPKEMLQNQYNPDASDSICREM